MIKYLFVDTLANIVFRLFYTFDRKIEMFLQLAVLLFRCTIYIVQNTTLSLEN